MKKFVYLFVFIGLIYTSSIFSQNNVQEAWISHYSLDSAQGFNLAIAVAVDDSGECLYYGAK